MGLARQLELLGYSPGLCAVGDELEVPSVFGRNSLHLRLNYKDWLLLGLLLLLFPLVSPLPLPHYLLALPPAILNKDLSHLGFVSVNGSKVEMLQVLHAIDGRSHPFGPQYQIFVVSVLNNKVQDVSESA